MGRSRSRRRNFPTLAVTFNVRVVDEDASPSNWRWRRALSLALEVGLVIGQVTLTPLDDVVSAAVLAEHLILDGNLR